MSTQSNAEAAGAAMGAIINLGVSLFVGFSSKGPHNTLSWKAHKKVSKIMEGHPEKSRNHPQAETVRLASFLHHARPGKRSRYKGPV